MSEFLRPLPGHTPIVNGASTLRFGFSTSSSKAVPPPHSVPNVIVRFKVRMYDQRRREWVQEAGKDPLGGGRAAQL